MAAMPALSASETAGHALTTAARSGSVMSSGPPSEALLPDLLPPLSSTLGFPWEIDDTRTSLGSLVRLTPHRIRYQHQPVPWDLQGSGFGVFAGGAL